ncbi:MAG: BadF/BadG/BcrA/BcrD ATPase family protein [Acidobacteriota bacterium]
MKVFLAVDAGGTKTDLVLVDETRELVRVRSGTIKRMRVDEQTAARNLDEALSELSRRAGISMRSVIGTCIGTAGDSVPLVVNWLRTAFAERVSGGLLLLGDVEIALDAAFPGQSGILVLAGTGSNVAGRTAGGKVSTVGGWGPVLADQGSGHSIGVATLRALFLARDGGRPTQLAAAVLEFWKLTSLEELIAFANAKPAPDFSRLARLTLSCAESGDAVAAEVLRQEGESLAQLVALMIRRLQQDAESGGVLPPIAFAGSVMENVLPVRQALMQGLRNEFPGIQMLSGVVDPINGAVWRARREFSGAPYAS